MVHGDQVTLMRLCNKEMAWDPCPMYQKLCCFHDAQLLPYLGVTLIPPNAFPAVSKAHPPSFPERPPQHEDGLFPVTHPSWWSLVFPLCLIAKSFGIWPLRGRISFLTWLELGKITNTLWECFLILKTENKKVHNYWSYYGDKMS